MTLYDVFADPMTALRFTVFSAMVCFTIVVVAAMIANTIRGNRK